MTEIRVRVVGAPFKRKPVRENGKPVLHKDGKPKTRKVRVRLEPDRRVVEIVNRVRATGGRPFLWWGGPPPRVRDVVANTPWQTFCQVRVDARTHRYVGACGNRSCTRGCGAAWVAQEATRTLAAWERGGYVSIGGVQYGPDAGIETVIEAMMDVPLAPPAEPKRRDADPIPDRVDTTHLTDAERRAFITWDAGEAYLGSGIGYRKPQTEPTDEQWREYVTRVNAARRAPPNSLAA